RRFERHHGRLAWRSLVALRRRFAGAYASERCRMAKLGDFRTDSKGTDPLPTKLYPVLLWPHLQNRKLSAGKPKVSAQPASKMLDRKRPGLVPIPPIPTDANRRGAIYHPADPPAAPRTDPVHGKFGATESTQYLSVD